jgi:putative ABC transport system permease protein
MLTPRFRRLLSIAWRESRTARRRLLLYMSSISLGVTALVAIDSFTDNVTESVHEQSRALLGGDVLIASRDTFSAKTRQLLDSFSQSGIGVARVTSFASMALAQRSGGTRLVQVRAVTPNYPFYGQITTVPSAAWRELEQQKLAVVDPSLLVSLDTHVGDTLMLGTARFVIGGVIDNVPGDVGITTAIGPRVFIAQRYLGETGLLVFGSRAEYQALLRMPPGLRASRFAARYNKRFNGDRMRMRTESENETGMSQSIEQLGRFLGVVGLVALLLGGIGVASGVHAFVMRKIDTVAVLRCLGATSGQVVMIYVVQAVAMGMIGALAGAALGVAVQFALPRVLRDFIPVDVSVSLVPAAVATGLAVGLWVALVFALRPLLSLRRISPLQTLRRDSDADVMRRAQRDSGAMVVNLAIVASVVAIAILRAGALAQAIGYSVAIGVAIVALWLTALALSWIARRAAHARWPFVFRQGLASLYRPGNQTRAVILALGFGVFLVATLYQLQSSLLRQLDVRMERARANVVFFDVQEEQEPGVDSIITGSGYHVVDHVPIVPMRIAAINGHSREEMLADTTSAHRRAHWALGREYRSTYRAQLASSERILRGHWFAPGDTTAQMSIERDLADELRVKLGDVVTWNVAGVQVPARVTSIRDVTWARFEPNFFVVFNPASLEQAPKQFALLAEVPTSAGVATLQRDVVRRYPGVSSLDLSLIQRTVSNVLGKVTSAMRFMALLSVAFGIPVLFSAVAATRRERLREGVLLKTLGATRRQVGRIMLAEYAMLGGMGSLAGVLLSVIAAWSLTKYVFSTVYAPAALPVFLVAGAMVALAIAIGLATSREVFRETPMAALREA